MSVTGRFDRLPEPPPPVTSERDQDRRLVRAMLAMTPTERLESLRNWARLAAAGSGRSATAP